MQRTSLTSLFSKLDFFKDIANQDEIIKVIALDDAINEFRRDNRFPWTIRKSTLKLFKDIEFYGTDDSQDALLTLNKNEVDSYGEAASYFNTDLNQFIEMVKRQRNLMTQIYINGEQAIGVKNIEEDIIQSIPDSAGDADNYSAIADCTKIGLNNVYELEDHKSISFNITGDLAEIKNSYEVTYENEGYNDQFYIRRIFLKDLPTSIELRVQTDDSNYIAKTLTEQVTGLPFMKDAWNYIGFPFEEGVETGTFDETSIASSKILPIGYTGIMYISYDSFDNFALQQYWFYSKFAVISENAEEPDKVNFLDYDSNEFVLTDSLIGPTKWIGPVIKKARQQLLLGIENEYLRNHVSKRANDATAEFDRNFPNQEPKLTTVTRRFNNNPEEINYVP